MIKNFYLKPFEQKNVDVLINFSKDNPVPPFFDENLMRRFLTELASSEDLVFDYFNKEERVAVAVLLDRPVNGANSANLEIIGLKNTNHLDWLVHLILNEAKKVLPQNRTSIDLSHYETGSIPLNSILANDFKYAYSIYDMATTEPQFHGCKIPPNISLSSLQEKDFKEYHAVVMEAFKKNEDANIPPLEDMYPHLLKAAIPPTVLKCDEKIIGFIYLKIDPQQPDEGGINTIGVLPSFRKMNFGQLLLEESLKQLQSHGVKTIHLSVSANNENALHLYKKFGFKIIEKSSVYRWKRN